LNRWRGAVVLGKRVASIHPCAWILRGFVVWDWNGRKGGDEIVVECGNFGGGKGIRSWRDWG